MSSEDAAPAKKAKTDAPPPARIAVIGAAWWAQGWHLPQLQRNPDAEIAAIMQRSEQPTAAAFLKLTLETKTQLAARYADVPIFSSCEALLADEAALAKVGSISYERGARKDCVSSPPRVPANLAKMAFVRRRGTS